ncbi:MAG: UDP-N-acetylmuramate dehydrogenase [bacterium]|nr:UDP-N-acetylmuramate dehydrogenase [bacterium]
METPKLQRDVNLARFTTFGIGGPADLFTIATSVDELADAVRWAQAEGTEWFVLGCGANILVGDGGFRGLIIKNEAATHRFDGTRLTAGSGATIKKLIEATTERGLSGLEHYINIPSTVGGAMWQNLHFLSPDRTRTVFIKEIVAGARILTAGKVREVGADYFKFGYDTSVLHETDDVVLDVTFALTESTPEAMSEISKKNAAWRSEKHPPNADQMSAGSIFQKIEGIGAGRLIDQCGLKGYRLGGVEVSETHANYFLNTEGATAEEVRELIDHVRGTVKEKTGYDLRPEISFVGEF